MFRTRTAVVVLSVAVLALPAAATAGPLVADAPDCAAQSASKVFLPWADPADYVLAPGGAAESAAGWTLTGGAAIVGGNEPFQVHDGGDANGLSLPSGATATTGTMCVGIEHPDIRFFATSTLGQGRIAVEVLLETASGDVVSTPAGAATAAGWAPTHVMPIAAAFLPLLPGNYTPVQFRFTSTGSAPITIDDIYVDPLGRH